MGASCQKTDARVLQKAFKSMSILFLQNVRLFVLCYTQITGKISFHILLQMLSGHLDFLFCSWHVYILCQFAFYDQGAGAFCISLAKGHKLWPLDPNWPAACFCKAFQLRVFFTFLSGWKKFKKEYFEMYGNDMKSKFQYA